MKQSMPNKIVLYPLSFLFMFLAFSSVVNAKIVGLEGSSFQFVATSGYITTPEGNSVYIWGYGKDAQNVQYPGPTLIVKQGQKVTITLYSALAHPTSLLFPGQGEVTAQGGTRGKITQEATPGHPVTYSFVASKPGTYIYYSGSDPWFQIEMGLFGALIVRPSDYDPASPTAYGSPISSYDHEYLFLLSEMDAQIHKLAEEGRFNEIDNTNYFPVYWFINGRSAPDTMAPNFADWLPHQPYNCMPRMTPGEKMLMRLIGAGRDLHPFHFHGNHARVIAKDGRLLNSHPGANGDLSYFRFTITTAPGGTTDAIFEWDGRELGWDFYGHSMSDPHEPNEFIHTWNIDSPLPANVMEISVPAAISKALPKYRAVRCIIWSKTHQGPSTDQNREVVLLKRKKGTIFEIIRGREGTTAKSWNPGDFIAMTDHGKKFPVNLPEKQEIAFGGFYSGSPFLGHEGELPPGEGGLNPFGGFFFMWHSHNEKEMVNNNIFPGGMMTMMAVEPPGTNIE